MQVEPFQRSLQDLQVDVMINGRRRDHGFERAQLEVTIVSVIQGCCHNYTPKSPTPELCLEPKMGQVSQPFFTPKLDFPPNRYILTLYRGAWLARQRTLNAMLCCADRCSRRGRQ